MNNLPQGSISATINYIRRRLYAHADEYMSGLLSEKRKAKKLLIIERLIKEERDLTEQYPDAVSQRCKDRLNDPDYPFSRDKFPPVPLFKFEPESEQGILERKKINAAYALKHREEHRDQYLEYQRDYQREYQKQYRALPAGRLIQVRQNLTNLLKKMETYAPNDIRLLSLNNKMEVWKKEEQQLLDIIATKENTNE